jgi:hypothetical protein
MHSTLRKNMPEKNRKVTERSRREHGRNPEKSRKPTGKCERDSARTLLLAPGTHYAAFVIPLRMTTMPLFGVVPMYQELQQIYDRVTLDSPRSRLETYRELIPG